MTIRDLPFPTAQASNHRGARGWRTVALALIAAGFASLGAAQTQEPQQGMDSGSSGGIFSSPYGGTSNRSTGSNSGGLGTSQGPGYGGYGDSQRQRGTSPYGAQRDLYQTRGYQGTREESYEPRRPRPVAPPKPSEFQKFVQNATGRLLPVFGARFFEEAADSYAPVDNVPVPADYTVGPGDELLIRAWGSIDVDYRAVVDRNGLVSLPQVGTFPVAGVKASELEKHLRAQIGRVFTNFNLNVTLGQLRAVKVFVVGPAAQPGVYTLSSQSTLLSAVVAAGGPGTNGSMRNVSLRRGGTIVSELDMYEFLVQGDKSKDVQLLPGDVVVFQPAGPRVALTGATDVPGIYELRSKEEPLRELLRYAGGASVVANPRKVHIERIDATQPRAARFVDDFALDADGLQAPVRDGDVITLLALSPEFANAVTLRGHVAQPLRYSYKPGMRIRDLIPEKEALITPDFYRRKNLLVQIEAEEEDSTRGTAPRRGTDGSQRCATPMRNARASEAAMDGSRSTECPGDYSEAPRPVASAASAAAAAEAPAQRAEETRMRDPMERRSRRTPTPLFDEINWDYAVIERLQPKDLSTLLVPFNLGKAVLEGDPANNVELQPGDVVTIFSQRDIRVPVARQTRLVALEGEVGSPGVYQLLAGETLKQLIARAGGVTPQAYVYGLEFSREETRQRQRENIQQAIQRLEALSATQAARLAANASDDTAARASQISATATQAQLQRLRNLQPNGRIALELPSDDVAFDALPDVPLEAGDRVVVPARPGFVTVAGAVANNNAFLWRRGRTVGEYLKLAGVEETADPGNTFVLRADGTIVAAADSRNFLGFGGGIAGQPLRPGDAVFVPTQLDFETWGRALVRGLKDWSQIFYQFGLGAAAIETFRK
ncbi:MAG TPA: SLBB domain-containing protein [Burkholderiaceae bacterium]|nr:SLBB domain-containing protein [Burkholderiaceae bacterium]